MLFLLACATPEDSAVTDSSDLTVSLAPPAQGYQLVTDPYEVPAFSEVEICSVVKLEPKGDEQLAWIGNMESLSSTGTHHMNVIIGQFSFLDGFLGEGAAEDALGAPLGQYPCDELPTMELGFPIFPSQRDNQQITLPEGVAAPLALPLVAVFSHHYVNPTDTPLIINTALNLSTLEAESVESVGELVFSDIGDLSVSPGTRRSEARTCVLEADRKVALVSTHTHEWGDCATMNRYDSSTGQVEPAPFYVNRNWDQPPILHFEPGTFELEAGDGIHWACHYRNPTDRTLVNDGTAEGEMCVIAAVTWPSEFSVAYVEETVAKRDLVSLLGMLTEVMGPCDSVTADIAGPWPTESTDALDADVCADFTQTESNVLE